MPEILENAQEDLTPRMRNLLAMLWEPVRGIAESQLEEMNDEVERIASSDAACVRLRQIPGIGPLVTTVIVAAIGNGAAFHKGQEFAGVVGTGAEAVLDRAARPSWQGIRRSRQHLPAQDTDPWSPRCRAAIQARADRDGFVDDLFQARAPRNVLIAAAPTSWRGSHGPCSHLPGLPDVQDGLSCLS